MTKLGDASRSISSKRPTVFLGKARPAGFFHSFEYSVYQRINPLGIAAGLSMPEVVLLAQRQKSLSEGPESPGQGNSRPGPPQEPTLQGLHEPVQPRSGIFNILVTNG